MTIRRIVEGNAAPDAPQQATRRGLRALGLDEIESAQLAAEAAVDRDDDATDAARVVGSEVGRRRR